MQGRIKLHRKAQSNPISTNLELRGLFTYFLTKANHSEWSFFHGQQKIDLLPWQFIRSMQWIADHFSISKPKAYRLTELLEKSEIVIRKWYSKYTLFTIVNRWLYQSEWNATVTRSETPPYTNNNDKNKQEWKEIFFDQFWAQYPNKKSKDIAKKLFDKRIKSWIDPNIIIAWAKRYKLETLWKDKHYIKHPTTRLNAWGREDEQTIDIEVLKKLYQQEVAKDKENKKAIWDKFISEYWSDTMQQVLDKINTSSFISSLL